jgi:hypothetical protein
MKDWMICGLGALAAASLVACEPPKPSAPPPPSTSYVKVMPASAAPGRGQCLNDGEAATVRGRIVQQELAFAARHCGAGADYNSFAAKYASDLTTNGGELTRLLARRGMNTNAYVTDIANKVASRAATHGGFCADALEAFRWALRPATTRLADVPPLYDNSADHGTKPCNPPQPRR